MKEGLSLREAAEIIGVSHETVRNKLVYMRGFPSLRVGRRWIIPRGLLLEWMNTQAEKDVEE